MTEEPQSEQPAPGAEQMEPEPPRNNLSSKQGWQLYDWMKGTYDQGSAWSITAPQMAKVATVALGFRVTMPNVRKIRTDLFPRPKQVKPPKPANTVEALEKAVNALCQALAVLDRRVANLERPSLFPHK